MTDIERKYFTTSDYNKVASDILDAKIKQKTVDKKSDISDHANNSYLSTLATKPELKVKKR